MRYRSVKCLECNVRDVADHSTYCVRCELDGIAGSQVVTQSEPLRQSSTCRFVCVMCGRDFWKTVSAAEAQALIAKCFSCRNCGGLVTVEDDALRPSEKRTGQVTINYSRGAAKYEAAVLANRI